MTFTVRMVRELKGAPLSCLVLISIVGQPVSNEWLCRFSGYSDKPISQAVKLLSSPEYQLIQRSRGGWILTRITQMVLGESDPSLPHNSDTNGKSRKNSESRNFSDSGGGVFNLINQQVDSKTLPPSRNFSDSRFEENFKACKAAGMFDSVAEQIAALEYVTPEYINAHMDALQPGQGRGLAIFRIKENAPVPEEISAGEQSSGASFEDYLA